MVIVAAESAQGPQPLVSPTAAPLAVVVAPAVAPPAVNAAQLTKNAKNAALQERMALLKRK